MNSLKISKDQMSIFSHNYLTHQERTKILYIRNKVENHEALMSIQLADLDLIKSYNNNINRQQLKTGLI